MRYSWMVQCKTRLTHCSTTFATRLSFRSRRSSALAASAARHPSHGQTRARVGTRQRRQREGRRRKQRTEGTRTGSAVQRMSDAEQATCADRLGLRDAIHLICQQRDMLDGATLRLQYTDEKVLDIQIRHFDRQTGGVRTPTCEAIYQTSSQG